MKSTSIDLMIVGQGLAGSALAMQALGRGYRILVVDDPLGNRSSSVAAGLFNPVTGRRMSKTWHADALFPALHRFYTSVEQLTARKFFYPARIYRPFISIEEQNEWMGLSAEPAYRSYVDGVFTSSVYGDTVNDPYGGIALRQTGFLDTGAYLSAVAHYLEEHSAYVRGWLRSEELRVEADHVRYRGMTVRNVVFCQGVHNSSNPWFRHLPVRPLKGESISVQCDWPPDVILNRGVYMVPTASGNWRVGATYNRHDDSPQVTDEAREELLAKLRALIRVPFTVKDQQWGLRPTTPDRRPIIGAHPDHAPLIIFNGLGTKGVSMAPYFSEVLLRWLENEGQIEKEASVARYK